MLETNNYSAVDVDEENPYWLSFSDLMSGLLIIFILSVVSLVIELSQKNNDITAGITDLKQAVQTRRDILYQVQKELIKKGITVLVTDNETVLRIPEQTLAFESGKDKIPSNKHVQDEVKNIGLVLYEAILKDKRYQYLDTVFIEGHTDSDSIWYRGKKNWGLSTDRAVSVWRMWSEDLNVTPSFDDLTNAYDQKLFSVSGYAATRRVQLDEQTQEQKSHNRRIDIRFTVKRPQLADLKKLQSEG